MARTATTGNLRTSWLSVDGSTITFTIRTIVECVEMSDSNFKRTVQQASAQGTRRSESAKNRSPTAEGSTNGTRRSESAKIRSPTAKGSSSRDDRSFEALQAQNTVETGLKKPFKSPLVGTPPTVAAAPRPPPRRPLQTLQTNSSIGVRKGPADRFEPKLVLSKPANTGFVPQRPRVSSNETVGAGRQGPQIPELASPESAERVRKGPANRFEPRLDLSTPVNPGFVPPQKRVSSHETAEAVESNESLPAAKRQKRPVVVDPPSPPTKLPARSPKGKGKAPVVEADEDVEQSVLCVAVDGETDEIVVPSCEPMVEDVVDKFTRRFPSAVNASKEYVQAMGEDAEDWRPEMGWQGGRIEDLPEYPVTEPNVARFRRRFAHTFHNLLDRCANVYAEAGDVGFLSVRCDVMTFPWLQRLGRVHGNSAWRLNVLQEYLKVIPSAVQKWLGARDEYDFEEFKELASPLGQENHGVYFSWPHIQLSDVSGGYTGGATAAKGLDKRASTYKTQYEVSNGGSEKDRAHQSFFTLPGAEMNIRIIAMFEQLPEAEDRWIVNLLETLLMVYTRTIAVQVDSKLTPMEIMTWCEEIVPADVPRMDWLPLNGTWTLKQGGTKIRKQVACRHCNISLDQIKATTGAEYKKGYDELLDKQRPWLGRVCGACSRWRERNGELPSGLQLARRRANLELPPAPEDYLLCKYCRGTNPDAMTMQWTIGADTNNELLCMSHRQLGRTKKPYPEVLYKDDPEEPHTCEVCHTDRAEEWRTSWEGKTGALYNGHGKKDWPFILCMPCADHLERKGVDWRATEAAALFRSAANKRPRSQWSPQTGSIFRPSIMANCHAGRPRRART
ncbi:unnamed protein product [Zymoseptoria tritici ST99CH_3D1]|nr:unnamed protein product [Zymoseptoria tritici ST99CH_3D1]